MEDPRTIVVLQLAVSLMTSGHPLYARRPLAEVTSEILGSAQGIDIAVFGIAAPDEEETPPEGEQ